MTQSKLYYEAHITIEPVHGRTLDKLATLVKKHHFRVADLLMQKRPGDTPERSRFDTFCTTRHSSWETIFNRTKFCVADLKAAGFKVWRYKIEDTLLDSNIEESPDFEKISQGQILSSQQ